MLDVHLPPWSGYKPMKAKQFILPVSALQDGRAGGDTSLAFPSNVLRCAPKFYGHLYFPALYRIWGSTLVFCLPTYISLLPEPRPSDEAGWSQACTWPIPAVDLLASQTGSKHPNCLQPVPGPTVCGTSRHLKPITYTFLQMLCRLPSSTKLYF